MLLCILCHELEKLELTILLQHHCDIDTVRRDADSRCFVTVGLSIATFNSDHARRIVDSRVFLLEFTVPDRTASQLIPHRRCVYKMVNGYSGYLHDSVISEK